jgi:hypothetical protein
MIDENCMTILGCYVILSQDLNANYIVSKTELGLALGSILWINLFNVIYCLLNTCYIR